MTMYSYLMVAVARFGRGWGMPGEGWGVGEVVWVRLSKV
jgi:hypothetical protein